MDHWVTAYKLVKEEKATQLTLTYREVANDFREEVRQSTKARIPGSHRIAKGSFSPSFAAKEGNAHQEDAPDDDVVPGSDRGEQNNGRRKRQRGTGSGGGERPKKRSNTASGTANNTSEGKRPTEPEKALGTATTTCPYYGQFHRLAKCFYAFPELAPDGFIHRDHVRTRVEEALLNPNLQKEVERLRHQKGSQS